MERFLFEFNLPVKGRGNYQASVPARNDVITTFVSTGGHFINCYPLDIPIPKLRWQIYKVCDIAKALIGLRKVHEGDEVYFQYPYYSDWQENLLKLMIKRVKEKGAKITLVIHDLDFLRYSELSQSAIAEIGLLNEVDRLLVHTKPMKDRLIQLGVKTKMDVMIIFDYYAKDPYMDMSEQAADRHIIAFAGNLNKSVFLRELDKSVIPSSIKFRFYGYQPDLTFYNPQISYEGKFHPEHTSSIHAGWGLVWDGDSINTCGGTMGEYLRLISPHKLSLYLASGIPVIVWSQCAHAKFVKDNNVGITVDKISDAYDRINSISDDEYKEMAANARRIGDKLRHGEFLKRLIASE